MFSKILDVGIILNKNNFKFIWAKLCLVLFVLPGFTVVYPGLAFGALSTPLPEIVQIPGVFSKSCKAFSKYLEDNRHELSVKMEQTVCSQSNTPLPLPERELTEIYLLESGLDGNFALEQGHSMFAMQYVAFCIDLREQQEQCMKDSDCNQTLCQDNSPDKNASGEGGSLEDIYDVNAKDLIAIP